MPNSIDINALFSGHVFAFLMIFTRMGGVIMMFPGLSESYVPARSRLMFALAISLLLVGPLYPRLPPLPAAPAELARLISYELIVGLFFGTVIRLLTSALEATGFIIGAQTGLSNATIMNPAIATQSPLPSAFLSTAALVLIFITGADHFLLRTAAALYDVFPAGGELMPGDMAQTVIRLTNNSFTIGIEFSAPFIIMGLLMYTALGLMQRLMPSVQLFMISMPIQIWGGLLMFMLTISLILTLWLQYLDDQIGSFLQK